MLIWLSTSTRDGVLFDLAGLNGELEDLLGCPVNVVEHDRLTDDRFSRRVRRDMVPL